MQLVALLFVNNGVSFKEYIYSGKIFATKLNDLSDHHVDVH